jgi:hypothetical protein
MKPISEAADQHPSRIVTVLAWLVIVASALALPISLITLLMVLAKSYGTESADLPGFLTIVVLPPASLVAGIGLLRRRWWAWLYLVGLLLLIAANGLKTTIMASAPTDAWPLLVVSAGLLVLMLSPRVRAGFAWPAKRDLPRKPVPDPHRDWRVGHRGRDAMYYEELRDGAWQRIDVEGEMLTGSAHHVIYFASPRRWENYPQWARHRRDEIIARIKSEFRTPDYEYQGDDPG